jgi:YegS/Rv2252/BmrU family lipid kinase
MPAPKAVFLVNPASANGSTGRRFAEIARRAGVLGLTGDALFSERPGHLAQLARSAAAEGADLLVVVGGDGSVHEVVNGLAALEHPPELAVIPRGTGWDFVRTFRIPRDIEAAVEIALSGAVRTIDIGRVTYRAWSGDESVSHFANVASAGMSGAIAQRANETTKALGGKASYAWATFAVFSRWQASDVRVVVDGEIREGRLLDVIVANAKFLGGGMKMCPDAEPDDGLFDVLTIGDVTKRDLVVTMPKIYRGSHLPHPKAELLRGRLVSIDAQQAVPIQLDGEQPGTTPARFEIVPHRLRLRVPAP